MNVCCDTDGVYTTITDLDRPCYVVRVDGRVGVCAEPPLGAAVLTVVPPLPPDRLGSADFLHHHGVRYPYMAGAMAGGIASVEMVATLARAGYLASLGAAGLPAEEVDRALTRLADEAAGLPYASNLIHSPKHPQLERTLVELYRRHRLRCVEASAYLLLTPEVVAYRVSGLRGDPRTGVHAENRVIAKLSRPEVAEQFLRPAPEAMVAELVAAGRVTTEQAELARRVPMADDITVEADSAGHTDRRSLTVLLPLIVRLRDEIARAHGYPIPPRIGAAGSLGTPRALAAAFAMGAAYVVTGSVNQSCVEAGTSPEVKRLLAEATPVDCAMAPAADMFEMGVQVQVLRRGTRFAANAAQLDRWYREHGGIEDLPADDRRRLQTQILRRDIDSVWRDTTAYLEHNGQTAHHDPKQRMALIFRWYLANAWRWATVGAPERAPDYQIWCGPAMGAFNDWVRGTALAPLAARHVADVAEHLLRGAAVHTRATQLRHAGLTLPDECGEYRLPEPSHFT
jgi:trans-AT polyketide synthase/acyltransferase/oxidoreductase domain-containing protein